MHATLGLGPFLGTTAQQSPRSLHLALLPASARLGSGWLLQPRPPPSLAWLSHTHSALTMNRPSGAPTLSVIPPHPLPSPFPLQALLLPRPCPFAIPCAGLPPPDTTGPSRYLSSQPRGQGKGAWQGSRAVPAPRPVPSVAEPLVAVPCGVPGSTALVCCPGPCRLCTRPAPTLCQYSLCVFPV